MQDLTHRPIRPPRDMIEEQVYSRHWEMLMTNDRDSELSPLEQILYRYPEMVDQRAASVAARFICWIGTNVGSSFLRMGRSLSEVPELCGQGYLAAWGVYNRRFHATNGGARAVEFLVRTEEDQRRNVFPRATLEDVEVVEQVASWLGSDEGVQFVAECEAEIER